MEIYLEVIKNGSVVESIPLYKSSTTSDAASDSSREVLAKKLIGRNGDVCDVVLLHASISRKHAIIEVEGIASTGDVTIQLTDLNSSHGTFVNKRKVAANQPLILSAGDVMAFGASTRLYHIMKEQGQEDHEEEKTFDAEVAMERARERKRLVQTKQMNKIQDTQNTSNLKPSAKEKKILQKIELKKQKMKNLEVECARIKAKETSQGMFSDGQTKTLERNEIRIASLQAEIDDMNEKLQHDKEVEHDQATKFSKANKRSRQDVYNSDDDDFFDRTKRNKSKTGGGTSGSEAKEEIETYETLKSKIMKSENEKRILMANIQRLKIENSSENIKINAGGKDRDALDEFMHQNTESFNQSNMQKLTESVINVDKELTRLRTLLQIAQSALDVTPRNQQDTFAAPLPKPIPKLLEQDVTKPKPPPAPTFSTPEPSKKPTPQEVNLTSIDNSDVQNSDNTLEKTVVSKTEEGKLSKDSDSDSQKAKKKAKALKKRDTREGKKDRAENENFTFIPPGNQIGDGRNRFNEKYGY
mmetsp:Transcript_20953/g.26731  ORF Transcript_20953/g.26731 Transcript_20953/m.26731 type:complete len:528 (-) Transcript_20953:1-1584(-)|eukprot:CAMPEP_0204863150 /NCGR_PEP_ID=MMETSP1348-20121228/3086_1 /ASSEMBLY_ACC=CAM_ASM_000700 /TAXON_ID=215587 /ORGANISM="Aplanochytrium stocchinoi, Strain GSBS06" /LENGTH=527 /DNA_ID=CAMNT_0052013375 /DNA_START=42 /DNA_END=1625 /DNA_ORIENTATION=+